jgi:hypothetical protein
MNTAQKSIRDLEIDLHRADMAAEAAQAAYDSAEDSGDYNERSLASSKLALADRRAYEAEEAFAAAKRTAPKIATQSDLFPAAGFGLNF